MTSVDVCIPTKNPDDDVIIESVKAVLKSIDAAGLSVNKLIIIDSGTSVYELAPTLWFQSKCKDENIELSWHNIDCSLAAAREKLINEVDTEWFVFLDDDAIVSEDYMSYLWDWTSCERVGAVRGRKERHAARHPTSWLKQRVRRAGVHCLLVRTDAVESLAYPPDITGVYEDEYMRHHVESRYRFVYDPRAFFRHETQGRHPPGWEEGKLAGKYGYEPFYMEALNVPYSVVQWRNPWPYTKRMFGWLYGRYAL